MAKKQPPKKTTGRQTAAKVEPRRSVAPFVVIGVVLVVAVLAAVLYLRHARQPGEVASGSPGAQPPHAMGSERAPVVLEEFGDFQCPPCGQMYPEIEKIRQDYGDDLRFIFREYPLVRVHPHALLAAHAAEAAGLQGKFWEMQRSLFENQKSWSPAQDPTPTFEDYARRAGLDLERYRKDLGGNETDARVVADRERGQSIGVESTPTFFINGRKVPVAADMTKELRDEINHALGR